MPLDEGRRDLAMTTLREEARARYVQSMFARISRRYDLLNAVMSFGQDKGWRRLAARYAAPSPVRIGLDVATGTGDLAFALAERAERVVGLDFCPSMMELGEVKASSRKVRPKLIFAAGDALKMPFLDDTFDCATIGFGIRNIDPPVAAFKEMRRVVRTGGRVVCLEIMKPSSGLLGGLYRLYMDNVVPNFGKWLAKDHEAYRYLSDSVFNFSGPEEMKDLMYEAGFGDVRYVTLNHGSVAIHIARK